MVSGQTLPSLNQMDHSCPSQSAINEFAPWSMIIVLQRRKTAPYIYVSGWLNSSTLSLSLGDLPCLHSHVVYFSPCVAWEFMCHRDHALRTYVYVRPSQECEPEGFQVPPQSCKSDPPTHTTHTRTNTYTTTLRLHNRDKDCCSWKATYYTNSYYVLHTLTAATLWREWCTVKAASLDRSREKQN